MSKYPVERSDSEGIADALNYVLSGPAGLGQNFAGASFSSTGYLTGNFRAPFTSEVPVTVYVAPIALSTSELLDPNTWKFTFATPEPTPPFPLGAPVLVSGVSDSLYDGTYSSGVADCTTTYVITRTSAAYADPGPGTGGTVELNLSVGFNSTDGDARVVVNSASDRVFVSAQVLNTITYQASLTSSVLYNVAVNRYKAFPSGSAANPDFLFGFDETIAYRLYNFATLDPTSNSVLNLSFLGSKSASVVSYPVTYTVNPTTVTGTGSNLSLRITQFPTGAVPYGPSNTTIEIVSGGQGYNSGDSLVVPGNLLGTGSSPANDMTLTVNTVSSGSATLDAIDTVFVNIIDTPDPGFYRYILELEFTSQIGGDAVITQCELGYRSLTCQVVKE